MSKILGKVTVEDDDGTKMFVIDVYKLPIDDVNRMIEELQAQKRLMEKWEGEAK